MYVDVSVVLDGLGHLKPGDAPNVSTENCHHLSSHHEGNIEPSAREEAFKHLKLTKSLPVGHSWEKKVAESRRCRKHSESTNFSLQTDQGWQNCIFTFIFNTSVFLCSCTTAGVPTY